MFEYDSESRVVKSVEPDAGTTISYYDIAGRVRATQTQRQIDSGTATVMGYDGIDRAIYSGVWTHGMTETQLRNYFKDMTHRFDPTASALDSATLTENYYDRMPGRDSVLTALGVELYPASLTPDSFRYTKTRLVATVSRFTGPDGTLKGPSVAYRHDKKGRVIASYVYNGNVSIDSLKLLATETKYDLAGKVLKAVKYPYGLSDNGKTRKTVERYAYDRRGRVDTLYVKNGSVAETVLATYEYYPTGSVKQIALGGGALTLSYTYHISGAVKTAIAKNVSSGTILYSETLDYEDCGSENCTPQYAGNVSRMMYSLAHGNTNYSETRNVTYAYDLMNRLTSVNDAHMDSFDEVFAYDPQGRILSQRRGTNVANTAGGDYSYYAGKNRLASVSAGMSDSVDAERLMNADSNFVYDADGNMVYDASKKMTVRYDYRGLPTAFAKQELSGDSVRLLMTYDGAGNRISKRYERKAAAETAWTLQLATHYTGLGSEIRENGLDNTAKVVVNLPQGLGRYGVENAVTASATTLGFEWYLKNHLGSTLLVYGTGTGSGSVKAAYDYRAFGEQVSMVNPSDKVTENFTGKELDDETGLFHFGARTYDPMIAIWNGVDTKRQHNSSYVYGSNNPVNRVDPDGNADYDATSLGISAQYNTLREAGTTMNQFLWDKTIGFLEGVATIGKGGLKVASVVDPEPGTRFAANAALIGLDAFEGYDENGAKGAGLALGVDFTFMGLSKKLPDNLISRIGQTIANDLILEAGKKMLFGDKLNTVGSEPDLMPDYPQAPSDNTHVEW